MLKMSQVNDIKDLHGCGYSISKIAEKLHLDPKTVRKYVMIDDFSPKPPCQKKVPSILDPFKSTIKEWLRNDRKEWHKQRHTAQRIFDRLQKEKGYTGSYSVVQRYVKSIRTTGQDRGSQELYWYPGTAQVDFGEADFHWSEKKVRRKYLAVSFPYSNQGFIQVFGGETAECVCQGLKDIFDYIGGVPRLLIFDNATGVGHRVGNVVRETELFSRFRAHYGFAVRFCNPASGNEKGNVESKVKAIRQNWFVPVPHVADWNTYNRYLFTMSEKKGQELHYKKGIPIKDLFAEDKGALLALPRKPFNVCRYVQIRADNYGKICIDGKHFYSTRPENHRQLVTVGIRANTIEILNADNSILITHERQYGPKRTDSCDYGTSLAVLSRNPGAWLNSGVRRETPYLLRDYLDQQERPKRRNTLKLLWQLTETYGLETAFTAMEQSIRKDQLHASDAKILAERISCFGLDTAPAAGPSLAVYDETFLKGGDSHDTTGAGEA